MSEEKDYDRPDYPNCVMTAGVIYGVRERQRAYDEDLEGYKRRERERKEENEREEYERNRER